MSRVALATTHHDPHGLLDAQVRRALPALGAVFGAIAVRATEDTPPELLAPIAAAGALVRREPSDGYMRLGRSRRAAVALGLETGADTLLFCDFDRALHWAEFHPEELARTAGAIAAHDFIVLGRTPRAFASHPRVQRDTEAIINTVFAAAVGRPWDPTAGARGLSRRAAQAIVADCHEDSIGADVAWPLFIQHRTGLSLGYIETEGLEFETADRFPEQVAAAGGIDGWMAALDADPRQWAMRLELARIEVEAVLPYTG